ncbi:TPA: hypothetical protein ACK3Q6_004454 [Burkholderia cepacia]
MKKLIPLTLLALIAACSKAPETPDKPEEKPVAEASAAAKGYCDGTNTAPFLALNRACKAEIAAGRKWEGPNCIAYRKASDEADSIARSGKQCVGVRIRF